MQKNTSNVFNFNDIKYYVTDVYVFLIYTLYFISLRKQNCTILHETINTYLIFLKASSLHTVRMERFFY